MAQPPAYNRLKDFTENFGDETDHSALNAELDKAANSINDIRANLAILQADDGKLRPAVVTSESVSQTLKDELILNVTMDVQPVVDRALIAEQQAKTALENSQIAIDTANQASVDASNAVTKADDADLRATEAMDSAKEAVNFSLQARHLSEVAERDSSSALVTVTTLQENLPQNIENEVTKQVGQELIGTVETIVREVTPEIVEEAAASKDYVDTAVSGEASARSAADTALGQRIDNIGNNLATVAKTGSYNDLTNKPTIPTVPSNVSAFTNDAGYLTQHQDISNLAKKDMSNVTKPYVTEEVRDGINWYRKWSNNEVEQGGYVTTYGIGYTRLNFDIEFADRNYVCIATSYKEYDGLTTQSAQTSYSATTGITLLNTDIHASGILWYAKGQMK